MKKGAYHKVSWDKNHAMAASLGICLLLGASTHGANYMLGKSGFWEGSSAGSDSVVLAVAPSNSSWTASTNAPWLHLDDPFQSGVGSTNVVFTFDANPGATRAGTLNIAGQTLTITQVGSSYISAQTINTLVSTGLNQPHGVTVDGDGNLFIADSGNNAIKKWTRTNHILSTLISSGVNNPYSVAVDGAGNVYIADIGNNAIKEWRAANSNVTTLVSSGLHSPSGVAVDPIGNVYIADGYDATIYEWTVANSNVLTLSSPSPPSICGSAGVAVDIAGNVYFDSTCGDSLLQWTALGSNVVSLTPGWFYNPTGVAVDGSGNAYIADWADNWIWKWSATDGGLGPVVSGFNRPGGVVVDSSGNLYIADTGNNAIKEWTKLFMDPSPKFESLVAGSDSLPPIFPTEATQLSSFAPTSSQSWLVITGVTNGAVYFSFTASSTNRGGTITIFGQSFPVTQRGPSVSLGLAAVSEGPAAGSDSVILAVYPNTNAWIATANVGWLHLSLDNQSGAGSRTVVFSFDANPGGARSGTFTIAGQTLTVTQAGLTYIPVGPVTTLVSGTPYADGAGVDSAGNAYFAVANQNTIKKWTVTNNSVSALVSSGIAYPTGVAVDGPGNVYFNGGGIQKRSAVNGAVTALTGSSPSAFALDVTGNLYFACGNTIHVWTAGNQVETTVVSGLHSPVPVAVDIAGNIYFFSIDGIQSWSAASNSIASLASPNIDWAQNMAVDGQGNVYIAGQNSYYTLRSILKWVAASNTLTTLLSSGSGQFFGIAVDAAGNVYFTDAYNGLVREIPRAFLDPSPKTEGILAGNDSLPVVLPLTINLRAPFAPASDVPWLTIAGVSNGVVSYSFTTNLTLTRTGHINLLGQSIPVIQSGPSFALSTTNLYEGQAAGSDSVMLLVTPDIGIWTATSNVPWLHPLPGGTASTNVIFSFDANPGLTRSGIIAITGQKLTVTQAGSTYVGSGPLTTLANLGLSGPSGVAVDGAGNVYIADPTNNAIKKWTATNNTLTPLVSSGLYHPGGVATDAVGNIYIADTSNDAIKVWIAASNTATTLVSSGLSSPAGVTVDSTGNVYIADTGNDAIKKWSFTNGTLSTLVSSGLANPTGVAVDFIGNVYIADTGNNSIKKWNVANGAVTTLVSSGLSTPAGVAVDRSGNVYLADTGNNIIKEWIAASNTVTALVSSGLSNPSGVAVDTSGDVYIADGGNNSVKELPRAFVDPTARLQTADANIGTLPVVLPAAVNLLNPFTPTSDQPWLTIAGITNGVVSFSVTSNFGSSRMAHLLLLGQTITVTQSGLTYSLGANALLVGPMSGSNSVVLGVSPKTAAWTATANAGWLHLNAMNQSGAGSTNVIFSYDANTNIARSGSLNIAGQTLEVTQAGSSYVLAGFVGGLVSSGLNGPRGVTVDAGGNVYIADTFNNTIKKWISASNNVVSLVSTGLLSPGGLAMDIAGNICIADTSHNAIKEWLLTGSNVVTLVASGLGSPSSVAVDASGNVYIADTFNSAIKEWTPANNSVSLLISSGLSTPRGAAVDAAGNVYIADTGNNSIKKWNVANGAVTTLVSSGLINPFGVAVDGAGNVYIADTSHNAIKKWTAVDGNVTTLVAAGLISPIGVAVDGTGNLYIADTSHNAIKELPYVFVDPISKFKGLAAGYDSLPVVLPATANLLAPFGPTSDQPWLTITSITNGVVSFSFTTNAGSARTAHISLLGQTISITQGLIGTPPKLTGLQMLGNGIIQFSFTNNPSASFTVLSSTNISLPLAKWSVVGSATNVSSNLFQFASQATVNDRQRYYIVQSP